MELERSQTADIRVFSGGAPQDVLQVLAPRFEEQTGHRVSFTFAHISIIQKRLAAGERPDVILLPSTVMAAIQDVIALRSDHRAKLARVGIGVVARSGATPPDISTADAVRRMLLEADGIALPRPGGPAGNHVMRILMELGIADAVRSKLRHKPAIDGGAELVGTGEADVGLYLASEVRSAKGTELIGMLPPELQNYVVYEVAVTAQNAQPQFAFEFVEFLSDAANHEDWRRGGFELIGSSG